jgi:hypothetical protein
MRFWVRLPTQWIKNEGLIRFVWGGDGVGADNIAALMAIIAIAHEADSESGVARITYEDLGGRTGLSRAKLAAGLNILRRTELIDAQTEGRSHYKLVNYGLKGWGKLPASTMYSSGRIRPFEEFKLRRTTELDALKLFLLFVAFRGEDINAASIGYEKMSQYSGIHANRIKAAISLLTSHEMIVVDPRPKVDAPGFIHTYRIVGIDSRRHLGTTGRKEV